MSGPYHPKPGDRFETLSRAAFGGDPEAQFRVAESLRRGLFGLPVDEAQARHWYERAATGGHPTAIFLLNNWRNRRHFV